MVTEGDEAPKFEVPLAGGSAYDDVKSFTLSDALGSGPIVLAFFPAAFTGGCTDEMCTFRDSLDRFEALNATVYGISVDLPFAQNIWIQQHDLGIPMLSDWNHDVIHAYDVIRDDPASLIEVAQRSIFVVDSEGYITYRWLREGDNPDFTDLVGTVRSKTADALAE